MRGFRSHPWPLAGCQPWKDIYIKRNANGIVADRPVEFNTTIEPASSNPFVHSRTEFLEVMNVLFQNPAVLEAASRVGNTVFTGVYDRLDEDRSKFTFVLGRTGPWLANVESAGLVITRGKQQNIHYWTFGQIADE